MGSLSAVVVAGPEGSTILTFNNDDIKVDLIKIVFAFECSIIRTFRLYFDNLNQYIIYII